MRSKSVRLLASQIGCAHWYHLKSKFSPLRFFCHENSKLANAIKTILEKTKHGQNLPQYKSSRLSFFCVALTYFDIRQEHSPLALCRRCPSPVFIQVISAFCCWNGHILTSLRKEKLGIMSQGICYLAGVGVGHGHHFEQGVTGIDYHQVGGRIHHVSHKKYE